ncbi:MAG: YeiH family putative sulfate export transporter [Coprococcus sp.]|nr:YeiH family putative sulfate export transporter [Coprococcus sp.]
MKTIKNICPGLLVCLAISIPSWLLGKKFPVIGGAVFAILMGMIIALFWTPDDRIKKGITFTSKKILQAAVILLGFGLNLSAVLQTGKQSLPIIICTIATSLIIAFILHKVLHIDSNISTLIGVGSSICGGSAVAATAPVIDADDEEVAQAISVIFLFNVLAALVFPILGRAVGFDTTSGEAFGIFAGTAVNDTSSVTATASTWDSMWNLGSQTLDKAVTVKLTRTLAIIPITIVLAFMKAGKRKDGSGSKAESIKKAFPTFILWFVAASIITTICISSGVSASVFSPLKELSKFFIIMAMAAIGLGSNIIKLVKSGGKPILMGFSCWAGITLVSLALQHVLNLW